MDYVALQVKTSYSILNSLNDIEKLVSLAKSYGYSSLAITDYQNMFGVISFYNICKKNGIKPIIGLELSIDDSVILLYAKNIDGYKNLIKLSTIVSSDKITKEILSNYVDNLILVMPFSFYDEDIYNKFTDRFIGYSSIEERDLIKEPKVYISNVSYLYKDDYKYLDYANMINEGKVLGEYALNEKKGLHLLTYDEVVSISNSEDILNTKKISELCDLELGYTGDLLPVYDENIDSSLLLSNLSHKGLSKRLNNNISKEYSDRLDYELKVINDMGFNDYFLIVYDYILYAKKNNILVGPGRGSAAGSLVSYTLGITDIDPIKYNLLFERFLNSERVTMPDIDIDFDANKRNDVIDYVINKYGNKKVEGIISFNTLGAKQVIRDVGKILNINTKLIDSLAKLCSSDLRTTYDENINFKKLIDSSLELKKLFDIAIHLEGLPRHVSIHAAGIVMSSKALDDIIPLYKNQQDMYVTGYSKDYLEPLGLLKMDFLGLSNLTMIDDIISNIRNGLKKNITFSNIPLDDEKTIKLFSSMDLDGIFQLESSGMRRFLNKLKPRTFNDIVAAMALYRPGPMDSIDDYIMRKEGRVKIDYFHDDLKPILEETYGIIVYQEQIMQIARKIAGYSLGEADILRRAMSKKNESILKDEKTKFINGSIKNGYGEELGNKIYDLILKFANYGFNKSHAVSYTMIAYKMAFLKTYFYSYFMVSLLSSSINDEKKTSTYIAMLRKKNIKVIAPDINNSLDTYYVLNNSVISPLSIIKNISGNISRFIINERENNGKYEDFISFVVRTYGNVVNKKVITLLILSDVFKTLGYNKKTLIYNLDNIINYVELVKDSPGLLLEAPIIDEVDEYTNDELIIFEFQNYGFYITNHPVTKYRDVNSNTLSISINNNRFVTYVLEVNSIREVMTKNNDVMAFINASDEYSTISLTLFPKLYKSNQNLNVYDIIKVYGRVEKRFDNYQIIVSSLEKLN